MESSFGSFSVFVRVYIENGLRRWYDQNNRLKFILRNEFKIFNYEIKRKIISEVTNYKQSSVFLEFYGL